MLLVLFQIKFGILFFKKSLVYLYMILICLIYLLLANENIFRKEKKINQINKKKVTNLSN